MQELKIWKHNRFEAATSNTNATAMLSLPPGINGVMATSKMLKTINNDKMTVTSYFSGRCVEMWLEAAEVCQLTYKCPHNPMIRQPCRKLSDIGLAWRQCGDSVNCKRMAFIFDFFTKTLHQRALNQTHQASLTSGVMQSMGIVFDVLPADMPPGHKNCIQKLYSNWTKVQKENTLRGGRQKHNLRVNLGKGSSQTQQNWKRPKEVFFIQGDDPDWPGKKLLQKVRQQTLCIRVIIQRSTYLTLTCPLQLPCLIIQVDYSLDTQWQMWAKVGVLKLVNVNGTSINITGPVADPVAFPGPSQEPMIFEGLYSAPIVDWETSETRVMGELDWDNLQPARPAPVQTQLEVSKSEAFIRRASAALFVTHTHLMLWYSLMCILLQLPRARVPRVTGARPYWYMTLILVSSHWSHPIKPTRPSRTRRR